MLLSFQRWRDAELPADGANESWFDFGVARNSGSEFCIDAAPDIVIPSVPMESAIMLRQVFFQLFPFHGILFSGERVSPAWAGMLFSRFCDGSAGIHFRVKRLHQVRRIVGVRERGLESATLRCDSANIDAFDSVHFRGTAELKTPAFVHDNEWFCIHGIFLSARPAGMSFGRGKSRRRR